MAILQYRAVDSLTFAPELLTFNDLLTQMVDFAGAMIGDVNERNWKNAVFMAMRRIAKYREWKYYNTRYSFVTDSDATITASYDHTGGTSERLVTVTSGTLSAARDRFSYLVIGSRFYAIEDWKSATTFTLTQRNNPGADVASASMTIGRAMYPMPSDFLRIKSIFTDYGIPMVPVPADELDYLEKHIRGTGTPNAYAITGDPRFLGSQILKINPRGTGSHISMIYRRYARGLKHTGFDTNDTTGTVTTGGTGSKEYATLSGANEAASMLGAVIRLRNDTNIPEGSAGKYPYVEQRVIVQVDTTNHRLYFDRPTDSAYTAKAYCVSDPIDVAPHMLDALIAACRVEFARQQPKEAREKQALEAEFHDAVTLAMESERAYPDAWGQPIFVDRMHIQE